MPDNVSKASKIRWLFVITLLTVLLDQLSKVYATAVLKGQPPQSYFGDIFRIVYAENRGAFLSLFGNLPDWARWLILVAGNSAVMIVVVIYLLVSPKVDRWSFITWSLVFAGGVGNLIDRVRIDAVIDFLNLGIGQLRTGIFNIADIAITAGFFMLVWQMFHGEEPAGEKTADSDAPVTPSTASPPVA